MSIKQVSVVLFHKHRSRFLETTVTQLLVVALFPRPPTQCVIGASWKRPFPCSGTSPAECGQERPRARLCRGRRGREAGPGGAGCRVLCPAPCPVPCRGRGSGPGGMPRVAALPVWGKGSGPFPASPGPWQPPVGVVPGAAGKRRAGALRSFPAAVPASGAWRSPARSPLPAGRCRRPALRAPGAPLLGKGKGALLSGFGEPWGSSEQRWCLCS